jgi:hypothetical protein
MRSQSLLSPVHTSGSHPTGLLAQSHDLQLHSSPTNSHQRRNILPTHHISPNPALHTRQSLHALPRRPKPTSLILARLPRFLINITPHSVRRLMLVCLALINDIGIVAESYRSPSLPAWKIWCAVLAVWARAGSEEKGEMEDREVDVDGSVLLGLSVGA